jgi:hypothetical protein
VRRDSAADDREAPVTATSIRMPPW